jgi:hypothetical protein
VRVLGRFVRDKSLSVGELCRAAHYLLDLLRRLERKAGTQSRPRQRATFRVVRATAEEMAAKMTGTTPASDLAETDPEERVPSEQNGQGSHAGATLREGSHLRTNYSVDHLVAWPPT